MSLLKYSEEKVIPWILFLEFVLLALLVLVFLLTNLSFLSPTTKVFLSDIIFLGITKIFVSLLAMVFILNGLNGIIRKKVHYLGRFYSSRAPSIVKGTNAIYLGWAYLLLGSGLIFLFFFF